MRSLLSNHDNHTRDILQVQVGHITLGVVATATVTIIAIATGIGTTLINALLGSSSEEMRR